MLKSGKKVPVMNAELKKINHIVRKADIVHPLKPIKNKVNLVIRIE